MGYSRKIHTTPPPDGRHIFGPPPFHLDYQNYLRFPPPPLPFRISIKLSDTAILIYTQ